MSILISDKPDLKLNIIQREKEAHFILMNETVK